MILATLACERLGVFRSLLMSQAVRQQLDKKIWISVGGEEDKDCALYKLRSRSLEIVTQYLGFIDERDVETYPFCEILVAYHAEAHRSSFREKLSDPEEIVCLSGLLAKLEERADSLNSAGWPRRVAEKAELELLTKLRGHLTEELGFVDHLLRHHK